VFQASDETKLEPPLVNGASGKRCDIDGKPEQVSIGSMRIKANSAFTSTFVIETPSPPSSVALFHQGFAFYVSHHYSLHSSFSSAGQRLAGAPG
jgi:hypothetical protein